MSKKIVVITTGGTIGSLLQGDGVRLDEAAQRVAEEIRRAAGRLGYDVELLPSLNKSSESFVPGDWATVLHSLDQADEGEADGIVVTHGTDTMAHTVAAATLYNSRWRKRICFTGAFHPPNHPDSDALLNLKAAMEFVVAGEEGAGVYAAFRSRAASEEATIMAGASLRPMAYDEPCFIGAYGERVALYTSQTGLVPAVGLVAGDVPAFDGAPIVTARQVADVGGRVACLSLYPGIDREMLNGAASGRSVIVLQGYHSGTGPVGPDGCLEEFVKSRKKATRFLMGTLPGRHIRAPYESSRQLAAAGIHVYTDLQTHLLYVYSVLALALGRTPADLLGGLSRWEI